MSANVGLRT